MPARVMPAARLWAGTPSLPASADLLPFCAEDVCQMPGELPVRKLLAWAQSRVGQNAQPTALSQRHDAEFLCDGDRCSTQRASLGHFPAVG